MVEIKNKSQKYTQYIPYDILENILLRLPLKSLLRFKAVSKLWEATISDPKFAEIRLQQSKNSSCKNLFIRDTEKLGEFHVVKLEDEMFRMISAIGYRREEFSEVAIVCYCDGLYLKWCGPLVNKTYVLWNVSTRTYKKFGCPYPIDHCFPPIYGICYDPLAQDYKVVIADIIMKYYAVFYCRNNKWSEMKEFSCSDKLIHCDGVSFNGSFYWILTTERAEHPRVRFEIACFDGGDEKLKKLPKPNCKEDADVFCLTCLGGHLCLFLSQRFVSRNEITIMKKIGEKDSWIEFKVQLPTLCTYIIPLCLTNENEIILEIGDPKNYLLYSESSKSFANVKQTSAKLMYSGPFPYVENLFLV